jgi:hypothetical protein
VWYDLSLGKYKIKYTPLEVEEQEYPLCDSNGNILKKVMPKKDENAEKTYYYNEKTGEKHFKAFKLIKGKASEGFKGRIKEWEKPIEIDEKESEDLIVEKTYLAESRELYEYLAENKKALKFGGYFGNGYKVYRCVINPSQNFKGFLVIRCGRGQISERIMDIVGELEEYRRLKAKLSAVELETEKINRVKVEDMIEI